MTAHRLVARAATVTATAATLLGLSACGTTTTTNSSPTATTSHSPAAVAIVGGDANSPDPIVTPTVEQLIEHAITERAGFGLVDTGGDPRLYTTRLGARLGNTIAQQAADTDQLDGALHALGALRATTAQSDPWRAVLEAVGWLQDQGGGTLVVDNSGLGTTGLLDYRQAGLLEADPTQLVAFARANHELPDAQHIHVILVGIGWSSPPQHLLDTPQRANLLAQWTALLEASGAHVTVDHTPLTGPGPRPAPPVSTIPTTQVTWKAPTGTCGSAFNNTEVHFVVGTARLVNPASAARALHHLAATVRSDHAPITITGTTSSEGGPKINEPLSKLRATTIARLLETLRVPPTQIIHINGVGDHFPGYIPDTTPTGTLLPGPAAADRQVIITWPCH